MDRNCPCLGRHVLSPSPGVARKPQLKIFVGSDSYFYVVGDPETGCDLHLVLSNLSTSGNSVMGIRVTTQLPDQLLEARVLLFGYLEFPLNLSIGARWRFRHAGDILPIEVTIIDTGGKDFSKSVQLHGRHS